MYLCPLIHDITLHLKDKSAGWTFPRAWHMYARTAYYAPPDLSIVTIVMFFYLDEQQGGPF